MEKCANCEGIMKLRTGQMPDGISHSYYRCENCGAEILNMSQLHEVAEKYRSLKKYNVKLSKWGLSLGLRIPKELVRKYQLDETKEVAIMPEKKGIKIIIS